MGPQEAEQHEELPFSFHPWQKTVIDAIDGDADDRSILWVCSIAGNVGKSFLVNHLIEKRGALAIEPSKLSDVTHAILTRVETDDAFLTNPIIVVDVPRASSKMLKSDTFYKTLESILGSFHSTKYKGGQVVWKTPPRVLVTANAPPAHDKVSPDRFEVFVIKVDTLELIEAKAVHEKMDAYRQELAAGQAALEAAQLAAASPMAPPPLARAYPVGVCGRV